MSRTAWFVFEADISVAWGKTFLKAMERGQKELAPMIVVLGGFEEHRPSESTSVREALDQKLSEFSLRSTLTTANTIFPAGLWARSADREHLYERYMRLLPRLKRDGANSYGTYFARLISWGGDPDTGAPVNQLERIIEAHEVGVRRRTAFQATLFDPRRDITNQRQRGFPCLEHVAFGPDGEGGLEVSAFYTTQYIVDRAYGNYLGLVHLGEFIAEHFGLELSKVTCVAATGQLGSPTKSALRNLEKVVTTELA